MAKGQTHAKKEARKPKKAAAPKPPAGSASVSATFAKSQKSAGKR
jgi:hypothetical protein